MAEIRCASKEDLPRLVRLWISLLTDSEASDRSVLPCEENIRSWIGFVEGVLEEDPCQVLVAEADEKIVGYILYIIKPRTRLVKRHSCAVIYDLYVFPEYRGRGIGSSLLREALRRIRDRGVECVELTVWVRNKRALDLYKRFGFTEYIIRMRRFLG